jgi:hypothetical protein
MKGAITFTVLFISFAICSRDCMSQVVGLVCDECYRPAEPKHCDDVTNRNPVTCAQQGNCIPKNANGNLTWECSSPFEENWASYPGCPIRC